jgi:hypothetical protein
MEPHADGPASDEPREPPRPRRRRSALLFVLGAAFLILAAIAGVRMVRSAMSLLSDVELQVEGRPKRILAHGERVRLALTFGRPAAVIVYLQDPSGAIEEVYPPPGDVPLLSGTTVLPRGQKDAWDTVGLNLGQYFLWTVASREPIPAAERADLMRKIEEKVRNVSREERNPLELYDLPRRVLEAMGPRIEEVAVRDFVIDPLHPR